MKSVLAAAETASAEVQTVQTEAEQLRIVLDLQARVSKQALATSDVIEKLNMFRHRFQARLFYPDAPPIWRVSRSAEPITTVMSRSIARLFEALGNFVSLRKGSVTVLFL